MNFLKHLFGSSKIDQTIHGSPPPQTNAEQEAIRNRMEKELAGGKAERALKAQAECSHSVLLPQWNSVEDMGLDAKTSSFNARRAASLSRPNRGAPKEALLHNAFVISHRPAISRRAGALQHALCRRMSSS
jgi:hypothetical protein